MSSAYGADGWARIRAELDEGDAPLTDVLQRAEEAAACQQRVSGAIRLTRRLVQSSQALLPRTRWGAGMAAQGSDASVKRQEELAHALEHVRQGERLVARQRELVVRLSSLGVGVDVAQDLLAKLETSLYTLRDHLETIRREVAEEAAEQARLRPAPQRRPSQAPGEPRAAPPALRPPPA